MDHVVNIVFFDKTLIVLVVSDVKSFIFAREVELLFGHISGNNIVSTEFFTKGSHKRHTYLTLTSSN